MADGGVADRSDSGALSGAVSGTDAGTLGDALRRARLQRGLTIAQIAAATRIPARLLDALERDDIHAVPGGMYLRADVVAYADAVGLDRDTALARLHAAIDPPPAGTTHQSSPAFRPAVRWMAAATTIALLVAALVAWRLEHRKVAPSATPAAENRTVPDEPVAGSVAAHGAETPTTGTGSAAAPVPTSTDAVAVTGVPPAPAAAEPELEIVTEPAGARVTIDGVGWGITPVAIRYLPPGTKRLRITSDGFATEERVIHFAASQPRTTVAITLRHLD